MRLGIEPGQCSLKFARVAAAQVRNSVISGKLTSRVKFARNCVAVMETTAVTRCRVGVFLACEGIRPLQWSGTAPWRCALDCSGQISHALQWGGIGIS